MLEWRRKRVGLGREREEGDGRRHIRRGEIGKGIHVQDVTEILTNCCMFSYK